MNNYKKKASLQSQFFTESDISDLYILLPVFMDPHKGQYGPPKDLILAHDQEQLHRQRMYQYQIQQQKQMYGAEQQRNREAMMDRIKKTASVNMNYKQVSPAMMRKNQASRNMVMSYPTPPPPPSNKVVHTRHPPPAQTPSPLPSSAKIVHTRQPPSTKIVHTRQPHTSPSTPIPQQQYQYQQQRQHDHTQAYPSPQRIPTPSSQRAPTPSSPPTYMSSPPTGPVNGDYSRASSASGSRQYSSSDNESLSTLDEFRPPLWGNDRSFINVYNSGVSSLSIDDEVKPPSINDIPMLTKMDEIPRRRPSSRASSVKSVESGRRVMRIVNLKSANVAPVTKTPWQIKDDYNFENIKAGLEEGLGAVRGFKGEIRLSAK
jgi:hypothetical protein